MQQVPVHDGAPKTGGVGWYYDDFSESLKTDCPAGEQQRIAFSFGDLPSGSAAQIECFQPVVRIDPKAQGVAAVQTRCSTTRDCSPRSDQKYKLLCVGTGCQISCNNTPDCPAGWECGAGNGRSAGVKYCQLATCPEDAPPSAVEHVDAG